MCYPSEMLRATAGLIIVLHGITFGFQALCICPDDAEGHSTSGYVIGDHGQVLTTVDHLVGRHHGSQPTPTGFECAMTGCGTLSGSSTVMTGVDVVTPSGELDLRASQATTSPDNSPDPPPPRIA